MASKPNADHSASSDRLTPPPGIPAGISSQQPIHLEGQKNAMRPRFSPPTAPRSIPDSAAHPKSGKQLNRDQTASGQTASGQMASSQMTSGQTVNIDADRLEKSEFAIARRFPGQTALASELAAGDAHNIWRARHSWNYRSCQPF